MSAWLRRFLIRAGGVDPSPGGYAFGTRPGPGLSGIAGGLAVLTALLAPALSVGQLPPDIMVDRFLLKAEQSVRDQDFTIARAAMERILALQEEHGLEPAAEDHYRYAKVWQASGAPERALESLTRYLQLRGRQADHYVEALELMNRAEADQERAAAGPAESSRSEPELPESLRRVAPGADVPGTEVVRPRAGESVVSAGKEFVWVPAGEFRMGSTSSEALPNEQPVTRVAISEGFYLGKYEVTQAEWQAVMGSNPSMFSGCGRCPVESVSWDEVQEYMRRLNGQEGTGRYRLPREAEWEYAARAGRPRTAMRGTSTRSRGTATTAGIARSRWGGRRRMRGGSTTCWGTCGSGCRTGTGTIRAVP